MLAIFIMSLCLILSLILSKMVYNCIAGANSLLSREKAFWLAEAGLERGKAEIANNLSWFTDLPHYPPDDTSWIESFAAGQSESLGDGSFKLVREQGKNALYSVGLSRKSAVILKLRFIPSPYQTLSWEEL